LFELVNFLVRIRLRQSGAWPDERGCDQQRMRAAG